MISDLEDIAVEITDAEEKKRKRNEDCVRDLWVNIKCTDIHITGEKRERKGLRTHLRH